MNTTEKGLTILLRSAVTGESLALPADFRLEEALPLIRSHSLTTLAFEGAGNCGIRLSEPVMQQLFHGYCQLLRQSEGQRQTLEALFAAFEAHGIDYLPLKGCNMKGLYPRPELRLMGDGDVLIRMEQYREKIPPLMEALGYQFQTESDHELIWEHKQLHLELHKRLIPSYNKKLCGYFGDGWALARPAAGHRYAMGPEDEFIYLFTHFTKHFRDGGIGCRHVLDLFVFRRSGPALEEARVRAGLEALGLLEFYENICRLLTVWFEDGESDEKTEWISRIIFQSGSWGSEEQRDVSLGLRGQKLTGSALESRLAYLTRIAFPRRNSLLNDYPELEERPWLLPVVWNRRLWGKLTGGGIKLEAHRSKLRSFTQEKLDQKRALLDYVGLRDKF